MTILSPAQNERASRIARLVGQVETMFQESGDPTGFDASIWLSRWLEELLPALGGARPLDYLDTMDGEAIVSPVRRKHIQRPLSSSSA